MTRPFRTPRWSLGILCVLLGGPFLRCPQATPSRAVAAAFRTAGGTEASEPPNREQAARAERGAQLSKVGVERWHQLGYRGQGVKVAVLDSGFRGWRDQLGKSLPDRVVTRSFRSDGNLEARDSQHGILCGEVVHALAPDAQLLFANWEAESPDSFLDAVRWAREQGAQVITCSIIMPSWGDGEGGGPVHHELKRILGGNRPDDILCFASAGNTATRTWTGTYRKAGSGYHEWTMGISANPLTPWGLERVSVELCWAERADFEVVVEDAITGQTVAASSVSDGDRHAVQARFDPEKSRTYCVRVRQVRGAACAFQCVALGGNLDYSTTCGSVCFPGDGAEVIAVGAVDADGRRMSYSSCGFAAPRLKPDLMATVPFTSLWRDKPFSGTSAASPQAAALAALWRSRHPNWSALKIREVMCNTARDIGIPGPDNETGYGLIQLPSE